MPYLIFIGNDSVTNLVCDSFIPMGSRKQKSGRWPISSDQKPLGRYRSGVSNTFLFDNQQINYKTVIAGETVDFSTFTEQTHQTYKEQSNFNVVVCLDAAIDNVDAIDQQIEDLQEIRGDQFFNIIPIVVLADEDNKTDAVKVNAYMQARYPELSRAAISIPRDSLENNNPQAMYINETVNHPIVKTTLDIALTIPLYTELHRSIQLLSTIEDQLNKKKLTPITSIAKLEWILKNAYTVSAQNDEPVKNALNRYFNANYIHTMSCLVSIKSELDRLDIKHDDYITRVFANVLCSIAAVLSMFTLITIPFVYNAFYQNRKRHGHMFKFFATTPGDALQASIVDAQEMVVGCP